MHLRQEQGQSLLFLFQSPVCLSLQILAGVDVKKAPFGACFSSSPDLDQRAGLDGSL